MTADQIVNTVEEGQEASARAVLDFCQVTYEAESVEGIYDAALTALERATGVNGTPKLTPWRHLKSDPLGGLVDLCWIFWFWCPGRRGGSGMVVSVLAGGGRNAPQIAVFKPVAVPFKRENLRVMD